MKHITLSLALAAFATAAAASGPILHPAHPAVQGSGSPIALIDSSTFIPGHPAGGAPVRSQERTAVPAAKAMQPREAAPSKAAADASRPVALLR